MNSLFCAEYLKAQGVQILDPVPAKFHKIKKGAIIQSWERKHSDCANFYPIGEGSIGRCRRRGNMLVAGTGWPCEGYIESLEP